jgi:uncharacterized membrane protein YjgN (DUF898 family)
LNLGEKLGFQPVFPRACPKPTGFWNKLGLLGEYQSSNTILLSVEGVCPYFTEAHIRCGIVIDFLEKRMSNGNEGTSVFDGSVLGNFGTNLAASLLCLITLGIGVPWAVAYRQRWLTSHTIIEGKRLKFDGTGAQLFGKYIIWFLLSIITLGIYAAFFLPVRVQQWVTKHTLFE